MSMKFISHKTWHPRRLDNIRKVAIAEAKYNEEQTKMAELRREREEEKDLEELRKANEAAGRIEKAPRRVNWIYEALIVQKKGDEDEEPEEERVNPLKFQQRPDAIMQDKVHAQMTQTNAPGSKFLGAVKESKGDKEMKMREDPFTAIFNKRKQEEERKKQEQLLIEQASKAKFNQSRTSISKLYPVEDDDDSVNPNQKNQAFSLRNINRPQDKDTSSDSSSRHHSHHHHHHHHSRH